MAVPAYGPTWHRLNPEQRRVLSTILSRGLASNARLPELVAAAATSKVEANYGNPSGGHADSVGWRQERGHYGSAAERMNVARAADRFFNETGQNLRKYPHYGRLAQSVQRSAFPGRYAEHGNEAKALVREYLRSRGRGGAAPSAGGGGGGGGRFTMPTVSESASVQPRELEVGGLGMAAILAQEMAQAREPAIASASTPQTPWYSAQRFLPQGAGSLPSFGPPPRQDSGIEQLLAKAAEMTEGSVGLPAAPVEASATAPGRSVQLPGGAAPAPRGSAGKGIGLVAFGQFLKSKGIPVTEHPKFGGVGGGHARGYLGNHYDGQALDIPVTGAKADQVVRWAEQWQREGRLEFLGPGIITKAGSLKRNPGIPGHTGHVHVSGRAPSR